MKSVSASEVAGLEVPAPGEGMARAHDGDELVVEERVDGDAAVPNGIAHDPDVEIAREQRGNGAAGGLENDADLDSRVRGLELPQRLRQPVVAGVALGREPQQARRLGRARRHVAGRRAHLFAGAPRGFDPALAGGRRRHALVPPLEERDAERPFGVGQLMRQGGLRQVEAPGGRGERAFLGDREQELEVAKLEAPRRPVHTMNISHEYS